MSYRTLAQMVGNSDLIERITACAAVEQHPNPDAAARPHMWKFVTSPGWAEKFAASANKSQGADEGAVTDEMILEAFKRIVLGDTQPPDPDPDVTPSPAE